MFPSADIVSLNSVPEFDHHYRIGADVERWLQDFVRLRATCTLLHELELMQAYLQRHGEADRASLLCIHGERVAFQWSIACIGVERCLCAPTGCGGHVPWQSPHCSTLRCRPLGQECLLAHVSERPV